MRKLSSNSLAEIFDNIEGTRYVTDPNEIPSLVEIASKAFKEDPLFNWMAPENTLKDKIT